MRKFLKLISIFAILILTVSPGFSESEPQGEFEPLSKEFLEWREQHEQSQDSNAVSKRVNALPSDSDSYSGYIPIPVDLSYLADNPPILNNETENAIAKRAKAVSIPTKYDLRDKNVVTSVKSQLPYGTCWAFASIGAIESNMLMQGKGTYDLSEMHLAWFAFRNSDKSKAFFNLNSSSASTVLDHGGNSFYSTALLARLGGPVAETEVPYGEDKIPTKSTPEEYTRVLRLREAFYLNTSEFSVNASETNRNIIKERIIENGSVVASYKNNNNAYYKTEANGTSFYSTSGSEGHAIQIVGWDDDYPINAFKTKPSIKGAWLIKNSWGNTWNSGKGDNGYFWMSYAQNLTGGAAFVAEAADNNMNVYSYDDLGWCQTWGYSSGVIYAANIFKSERSEKLTEVGLFTPNNNIEYEISVYKGLSSVSASSPKNGSVLSTASGKIPFAGYHTVALNNEVSLSAGEIFSVVVKFNNYPKFATEAKISSYSTNAEIETGSLFSNNGTSWITGASKNMNACIKAFTTTTASKPTILTPYPPDAVVNQEYSYMITASGSRPITWAISGNFPTGFSVISSTGELVGTPTKTGNYTFSVTASNSLGNVSKSFTMNVKEITITPSEITGYVNASINETLKISGATATSWSVSSGTLPSGLKLTTNTGAITGKPKSEGTSTVKFKAATSTGDFSHNVKFTINPQQTAPKFTTSTLSDGLVDTEYSATKIILTGTEPITLSAEGLPNGMTFNSSTKTLAGTPTAAGTYTVKFTAENTATDLSGNPVTKSIKLKIKAVPPVISSFAALNNAVMNEKYNDVLFTTSAGTAPITWSASGLPKGMTIDSSTGILSGTPTKAGNFKISIKASNAGGKATLVVPLTVLQKPEITTKSLKNATTDKNYSVKISTKGNPTSWEILGLPDTLIYTVAENQTSATISGVPTAQKDYTVKITVKNEAGENSTELPLKVNGVKPKLSISLKTGNVDENYQGATISATGTKPITISIPDETKLELGKIGLSFTSDSATGTANITGTPTKSVKNLTIAFTATNVVETATKTTKLTISGVKPSFTSSTSSTSMSSSSNSSLTYVYEFGENIDIDLTVSGTKDITITMPSSNGFSLKQTGDYTATISGTAPTTAKKITLKVTASNADGKVTKSIIIQTKAKTDKTLPKLEKSSEIKAGKSTNQTSVELERENYANYESESEANLTLGEERKIESIGHDILSKLESEGYKIAAILPEISVTEDGMYELEVDLDKLESNDITGESKLYYFAFPRGVEDSEDDEIIEFYDSEENEITTVPENLKIIISAWFEKGIVYEPIIAVKE